MSANGHVQRARRLPLMVWQWAARRAANDVLAFVAGGAA
jgi:hypothetical protein